MIRGLNGKYIEFPSEIILSAQMSGDYEKIMWLWDSEGSMFDRDTLVRVDLEHARIIYIHFCLISSWKIVVDQIKHMEFVNSSLLMKLVTNG